MCTGLQCEICVSWKKMFESKKKKKVLKAIPLGTFLGIKLPALKVYASSILLDIATLYEFPSTRNEWEFPLFCSVNNSLHCQT